MPTPSLPSRRPNPPRPRSSRCPRFSPGRSPSSPAGPAASAGRSSSASSPKGPGSSSPTSTSRPARRSLPRLGDAAAFTRTDITDADEVQALVDSTVERFGGLHVMANNAGVASAMVRFLHDDLSDFQRVVDINVLGVLLGCQRAARHMKAHGGGSIINTSSTAGINAGSGLITYRATKAAVIHASPLDRPRRGPVRHPGELPRARADPDGHDHLRHGCGAEVHPAAAPPGHGRGRGRGRRCSWPATCRPRSPASCCPSTAAPPPARRPPSSS